MLWILMPWSSALLNLLGMKANPELWWAIFFLGWSTKFLDSEVNSLAAGGYGGIGLRWNSPIEHPFYFGYDRRTLLLLLGVGLGDLRSRNPRGLQYLHVHGRILEFDFGPVYFQQVIDNAAYASAHYQSKHYVRPLHFVSRGLLPGDRLIQVLAADFRKSFATALDCLDLELLFQPYSIRRGGATHHFPLQGNTAKVMEKGRWIESRTARIYVNTALGDMSQLVETEKVHAASHHFRAAMHSVLQRGVRGNRAIDSDALVPAYRV